MPLTKSEAAQLYVLCDEIAETVEALIPVSRTYNRLLTSIVESKVPIGVRPGILNFWIPLKNALEQMTEESRIGGLHIPTDLFAVNIFSNPPEYRGVLIDRFAPRGFGGLYQKRAVRRYLGRFRAWLAIRATS